jgi:hypothetical protein
MFHCAPGQATDATRTNRGYLWMLGDEPDKMEAWRKAVGADLAAASLRSAGQQILAAASVASPTPGHA